MQSISNSTFGPLVAYLVPGATVVWGLSRFFPALESLTTSAPDDSPTIGGFLYLTLFSLTAGMIVSAVRWAVIDTIHAKTGVPAPKIDFSRLGQNVEAFSLLIDIHYKHYLFYSNMAIASAVAFACYRITLGMPGPWGWPDAAFAVLEVIFICTSRDTLQKYYTRSRQLLRSESARVSLRK